VGEPRRGDVDWAAVREAFREIGYSEAHSELKGGDEPYLRDVSPPRRTAWCWAGRRARRGV